MENLLEKDKWNKLLPYETENPVDAFNVIKTHIAQAVQQRDLTRGLSYWTDRLNGFLKINGYQIPKEDVIVLVKLYYSLLTQPDYNLTVIKNASNAFHNLLGRKVKKKLTRDDLVLDWVPLYHLCREVFYGKDRTNNLKVGYIQLETLVKRVVTTANDYFAEGCTQAMLDEWKPLICPSDSMSMRGTTYLSLFLPVTCNPDTGFKLWFDMVIGLSKTSTVNFVTLLTRLAKYSIGKIDWKPHIPWMFSLIMHDFNLQVGESHTFAGRQVREVRDKNGSAKMELIVHMMGGDCTDLVLDHLEILTKSIASYLHPSNKGRWTCKLVVFVGITCNLFLKRVICERTEQDNWLKYIPESHRLSQADIDRFVKIMLPCVRLTMFLNNNNFQQDYQCLVQLSPHIILPDYTERAFDSIGSVIEHQRVETALTSFLVTVRSMCLHEPSRQHVVPLLQSLVQTINSNDLQKSWIALLGFSFAFSMIPVVDCSHLLSLPGKRPSRETERVWRSTAQFKDLVAEYADRLLSLIAVSAMEDTGSSNTLTHKAKTQLRSQANMTTDYAAEGSIYMSFDALIKNSSDDIREMVLDKFFRFTISTTLEVKVAGKTMGDALSNLSNMYTEKTLKKFLPHLLRESSYLLSEEEDDGDTSSELLWNVTMLRAVLRGRGDAYHPYLDELMDLFERMLTFKNSSSLITVAVNGISDLLYLFLKLRPLEHRSCEVPYDDPTFDFTTTWGRGITSSELKLAWYVPGKPEYEAVVRIVERFGVRALDQLREYVDQSVTNKQQFQVSLRVLRAIQKSAGRLMPMFGTDLPPLAPTYTDSPPEWKESDRVPFSNIYYKSGVEYDHELFRGFRLRAAETVQTVYEYLCGNLADDTKSFEVICGLFDDLLTFRGHNTQKVNKDYTRYKTIKQMLEDKLASGKKKQLRVITIHRLYLQQQIRHYSLLYSQYTELHAKFAMSLLKMCVSNYTVVRKTAQYHLKRCLPAIPHSRWFVVPELIRYLRPGGEVTHEQLKGALYTLSNQRIVSYIASHSHLYSQVIPVVCRAQHSEKDSIMDAIEHLVDYFLEDYRTHTFTTLTTPATTQLAAQLTGTPLSAELVAVGHRIADEKDTMRKAGYYKCLSDLLAILRDEKTSWRFQENTAMVVKTLVQSGMELSEEFVRTFLEFLLHDSIGVRCIAMKIVQSIVFMQRRKYKETVVDPSSFADDGDGPGVGERPSNMWLQYRENDLPDTEEKYRACIFVDKPHWGYNRWPKELKVCIEIDEKVGDPARFTDIDRLIVSYFKDPSYVERYVKLYSLEDNKGSEKVDMVRRQLYRDLFRNYGWSLFELFRPTVEGFVAEKTESHHRFAAELITAITRGSKHWTFSELEQMWDTLIPLIVQAMQVVSSETLHMWLVCISWIVEDRDPRRFSRLISAAKSHFLSGRTIFHDASNLYLLETIISQFEWKYAEGLHQLLKEIMPKLNINYKNIRDKMGHIIDRCTAVDYPLMYDTRPTISPRRGDFMVAVLPQLKSLDTGLFGTEWVVVDSISLNDDNDAIKVVKTVTSWLLHSRFMYSCSPIIPEMFPFLSYLIALEPNEIDEDLKSLCSRALFYTSRELLPEVSVQPALDSVAKVVASTSEDRTIGCTWQAKCTALVYLQVMSFANLFLLRTHPTAVSQIKTMLFKCLESPQVEVRQVAGQTIGGLLRTCLFSDMAGIIEELKVLAKTPLPKGTKKGQTDIREIWIRHGAVKTLCDLVRAYPYTVPDWLPEVTVFLANFTRGNFMIANEVKKCMSDFKRTHLDSWHEEHKLKFTEDQLHLLQGLLVAPNYYA